MTNKIKGLVSIAIASFGMIGVVGGVALNNRDNFAMKQADAANAVSENKFKQATEGAHLEYNAIYFVDEAGWYGEGGTHVAFYFFTEDPENNTKKIDGWSDIAEVNWSRSGKTVYESIAPKIPSNGYGFTTWEKVIVVRIQADKDVANWDNQAYGNQSWNMTIGTSGDNAIFSYIENDETKYSVNRITAVERLEILSWTQGWSKPAAAGSTCDAQGGTDVTDLHDEWETTGTAFDALGEDVKYAFSHQVAEADEGDNDYASVPDFAARYDWIYYRYSVSCSLSNWADRTINF